jgi:hypothetical protein
MKRSLVLLGTFFLMGLLSGCGEESRNDIITGTNATMSEAAANIESVAKGVKEAVDKAQKENSNQLDFTNIQKPIEQLGKSGEKMQKIKATLESMRGSITQEEKVQNAENEKSNINNNYKRLVQKSDELETALKKAAEVNERETRELRDKIRKALGPFESLSRQGA